MWCFAVPNAIMEPSSCANFVTKGLTPQEAQPCSGWPTLTPTETLWQPFPVRADRIRSDTTSAVGLVPTGYREGADPCRGTVVKSQYIELQEWHNITRTLCRVL
jgi:hypothetical protein